jgi:hypothetical protein
MIRFVVSDLAHCRIRTVLLHQSDNFTSTGPPTDITPYYEPPFNLSDPTTSTLTPLAILATDQVAEFVKSRWTLTSTNGKLLRWFTTPLDANPTSTDDIITYGECKTNTIYIFIEIQDHDSGLTTSVLQGIDFIYARALIVLGTATTQYAHVTRYRDPNDGALHL